MMAVEDNARVEARIERKIKEFRSPDRKLLSDFGFGLQLGVNKEGGMEIAKSAFVGWNQMSIIAGATG
jgi:hypothetical protein